MFYSPNSEENSSASASDYDDVDGGPGYHDNGESNNNDSDNNDSDDGHSNASYGEDLRVRDFLSLEGLTSNSEMDV